MTVLRSGSATDVGRVRKVNQDLPLESTNLYAVADGILANAAGESLGQVGIFLIFIAVLLVRPRGLFGAGA